MSKAITIRQEGTRVHLIIDGRLVADLPWNAALEVAQAIRAQAGRAEEIAKREQVIFDHALLLRAGSPFGLALDPYLRREAAKVAQWDSTLRRALPGGIRSRETFGTPAIVRHPVPKVRTG